jgi:hypothetical protein
MVVEGVVAGRGRQGEEGGRGGETRRDEAETDIQLAEGAKVAVDEVDHGLQDAVALVAHHLAHHPEVEVHELAVGGGQQVSAVRVGVEEALFQHLLEGALDHGAHELRLDVLAQEGGREALPIDPLHYQQLALAVAPVDARHVHRRVVPVQIGKTLGIPGLLQIVYLLVDELSELLHDRAQVDVPSQQLPRQQTNKSEEEKEREMERARQTGRERARQRERAREREREGERGRGSGRGRGRGRGREKKRASARTRERDSERKRLREQDSVICAKVKRTGVCYRATEGDLDHL